MTTDTNTTTPATSPRFVLGSGGALDGSLLIPDAITQPIEVREASVSAESALAEHAAAAWAARAAEAELKQAEAADAAADRLALSEGNPLAAEGKKALPKAEAALVQARRRAAAAKQNAIAANVILCRAISSNHSEWSSTAAAAAERLEAEALQALEQLAELTDKLATARQLAAGLAEWPVSGGAVPHRGLVPVSSDRDRTLRERALQKLDSADSQFAARSQIGRNLPELIAGLRVEIRGRKKRIPATIEPVQAEPVRRAPGWLE
jgi:hypothetical protein